MNHALPSRKLSSLVAAILALLGGACATPRPINQAETAPIESVNVPSPPSGTPETQSEIFGPPTPQKKTVVVVLGPGLTRAYAGAGVLSVLRESKISVAGIVGVEMGALIGVTYVESKTISEFEWSLMKLKDDSLPRPTGVLRSWIGKFTGDLLSEQLKRTFEDRELATLPTPVWIGVRGQQRNSVTYVNTGKIWQELRRTLADPTLNSAWTDADGEWGSAADLIPFGVSTARALDRGPVIVVDSVTGVLGEKEGQRFMSSTQNMSESRVADLVLDIDVTGIGPFEYQKREQAVYRGKIAAQKAIDTIRRLIGDVPL